MKKSTLLSLGCALALIVGATPRVAMQEKPQAAYVGNAANGERLFTANGCYSCHNYNASGGRHGPRLAQTKRSVASLIAFVRKPATMPAYSAKVMSDQELTDVWAYVQALPPPPDPNTIAILKPQ